MSYELSAIEWKIHPRQIQKSISELNQAPSPEMNDIKNEELIQKRNFQTQYAVIEKFKSMFIKEYYRVRTSILEHRIEDTEQNFIRYIATNYSGLLKLQKRQSCKSPPEGLHPSKPPTSTLLRQTTGKINDQLHILFVGPLINLMESEFKNELIASHLMDTPIEVFLRAINSNNVVIVRHNNYVAEEYKPIYSNQVNKLFTLEYNNYNIEARYTEYLEIRYLEFRYFLESTLENMPEYLNKLKLLNRLKERISSVENFFYEDPDATGNLPKGFKYLRKDACNNLKFKLHKNNISKDLELFRKALIPLTDVQKIYITRSLQLIKSLLHVVKVSRQEAGSLDPQNQAVSNQLKLKLKDNTETVEKLQWRGNINQLITFFYDASTQVLIEGKPILNATKKQIVRLLTQSFLQKDGDPINQATINTIFTPSKELKRPPLYKRITIPIS